MNKFILFISGFLFASSVYMSLLLDDMTLEIVTLEAHASLLKSEISYLEEKINSQPKTLIVGKASYYSNDGCVGCREDRIMANGEVFDENKYTIAMNNTELGKWVKVINLTTDDATYARVTDTGGFGDLGRVADLSLAVKNAIDCTDLCDVEIREIE